MNSLPLASRRTLLRGLGMGGLGFLLPHLRPGHARAATGPRRLIFIPTFHGTNYGLWRPKGTGNAWEFQGPFASLAPFRAKTNLISGLDFRCHSVQATKNIPTISAGHPKGQHYMLTNEVLDASGLPQGPSIDIIVGRAINEPQVQTPIRTVVMGDRWHGHSFNGPRQGAAHETDAGRAYNTLFGSFSFPSAGGPSPRPRTDLRGDILDFLAKEYKGAINGLDTESKRRLEEHGDTLTDLKATLTLPPSGSVSQNCKAEPGITGDSQSAFFRLAALVVACDLSRVVTVTLAESSNGTGFAGGDWHQYLHDNGNSTADASHPVYKRLAIQAKAVADFLAQLDAIQEGDKTALDNSAVVWIAENANPSHAMGNHKVMVFGSMGGQFETGRYIDYTGNAFEKNNYNAASFEPHGNLFVSLARGMGLQMDHFGHPEASTGPLKGF